MHDQNIGMIQRTCRTRFLLESLEPSRINRKAGRKNFDGDITTKLHIASLIHLTHSTRANFRADFVTTEFCAGGECHCLKSAVQLSTTIVGVVILSSGAEAM